MKQISIFVLTMFMSILIYSCTDSNEAQQESNIPEEYKELAGKIKKFFGPAFDESELTTTESLDGLMYKDMGFSKDFNPKSPSEINPEEVAARGQWYSFSVNPTIANTNSVTFFVESNFPSRYLSGLRKAAQYWSAISPNIDIRETTCRSCADIICRGVNDVAGAGVAFALYPTGNGNVGPRIDVEIPSNNRFSLEQNLTLMVHEFGHTLGFAHADQNVGYNIPNSGTPSFHASNNCGSIMKSSVFVCGWTFNAANWSSFDRAMINWAYRL